MDELDKMIQPVEIVWKWLKMVQPAKMMQPHKMVHEDKMA